MTFKERIIKLFSGDSSNTEIIVNSPFEGNTFSTHMLSNYILSNNIIGPSFAVLPTLGMIKAPCDCTIKKISPTGNSLSFKAGKLELIINVGVMPFTEDFDKYYCIKVKEQENVKKAQTLMYFNMEALYEIDPSFCCVLTVRMDNNLDYFVFANLQSVSFDSVLCTINVQNS